MDGLSLQSVPEHFEKEDKALKDSAKLQKQKY